MSPAYKKIKEIIKEHKRPGSSDPASDICMSTVLEMVESLPTSMEREDLPYYGFELDTRIAAYVGEFLTGTDLAGKGDPYNPLYRIYELATRVPLFSALHAGRVILDQLAGLDHNDAPDYVDAYFMRGEVELRPGFSRPLRESELEFIHREAPEVINMLINESAAGA